MTTRSRLLALLVAGALVGLGAWRLLDDGGASATRDGDPARRPGDTAPAPPLLQGRERPPAPEPVLPAPDAPRTGATLTVRVLDAERGRAFEDAEVLLAQAEDDPHTLRTDGAGLATFHDLRPDAALLLVRAPDFVRAEVRPDLPETGSLEVEVRLVRGVVLAGTVVDARTELPVAEATVSVMPGGSLDGWTEMTMASPYGGARTDERGRFVVGGIAAGELCTARATAEGYGTASQSLRLTGDPDAPPEVVLRLPPAAALTGSVRTAEGQPAAQARVYAVPADAPDMLIADPEITCTSNGKPFRSLRGVTNDDGAFRIDGLVLDAVYVVFAELEKHGRSALRRDVRATEGNPRPDVDLILPGASSFTVRVWSPDGRPQEEGRVSLFGEGFPLELEREASGVFVVREPPAGAYLLRVVCPGAVIEQQSVEIRPAAHQEHEVRLDRGFVLAGVLVDDTGMPIANQKLFVGRPWQESGDHPPSEGDAETDADGRFVITGLRGGPHSLGLVLARHIVPEDLRLTPPDEAVRIVALRKGGFRARLSLPAGFAPPDQVEIRVGREQSGGYGESGQRADWNEGSLHVDDLAPGPCRIRIQIEGLLEVVRELTIQPGEIDDLGSLAPERGLELEGRVVDREGVPIAGARVTAGQVWTATFREAGTGGDGRFVLPVLARGPNAIEIHAAGFLTRAATVVLPGPARIPDFVLDRGSLVVVRVTHPDGSPAPARRVQWRPTDAPDDDEGTDSEETDAKGLLEVRLPAGRWTLQLLDDDWEPIAARDVELTEGAGATVELTVPR